MMISLSRVRVVDWFENTTTLPDKNGAETASAAVQDNKSGSDIINELDFPGSGANLEGGGEAIRTIYEYLRDQGSGQRSDFEEVANANETGYRSFKSFYVNCVRNGAVLKELPSVESPGEGGHRYIYSGE